jgi:hypothetical protein
MKFIVTWKYKNKSEIFSDKIFADNLEEAEEKATQKFSSNKRDWIDIILSDKSKGTINY